MKFCMKMKRIEIISQVCKQYPKILEAALHRICTYVYYPLILLPVINKKYCMFDSFEVCKYNIYHYYYYSLFIYLH